MAPAESRKESPSGAAWTYFGREPFRDACAANLSPGTRLLVTRYAPRLPPPEARVVNLGRARPAPTLAEHEVLTLKSFDRASAVAMDLQGAVHVVPWKQVIAYAAEWPIRTS